LQELEEFRGLSLTFRLFAGSVNIFDSIEMKPTVKGGFYIGYKGFSFVKHKENKTSEAAFFRCKQYQAMK
jgi:hypothetical protein